MHRAAQHLPRSCPVAATSSSGSSDGAAPGFTLSYHRGNACGTEKCQQATYTGVVGWGRMRDVWNNPLDGQKVRINGDEGLQ